MLNYHALCFFFCRDCRAVLLSTISQQITDPVSPVTNIVHGSNNPANISINIDETDVRDELDLFSDGGSCKKVRRSHSNDVIIPASANHTAPSTVYSHKPSDKEFVIRDLFLSETTKRVTRKQYHEYEEQDNCKLHIP